MYIYNVFMYNVLHCEWSSVTSGESTLHSALQWTYNVCWGLESDLFVKLTYLNRAIANIDDIFDEKWSHVKLFESTSWMMWLNAVIEM